MRVQQEFHGFRASISLVSMTGDTMSAVISREPAIEPSQSGSCGPFSAGRTSAMGVPRRVTRSGFFVLFTSSSKERHLALNSDTATLCMDFFLRGGICHLRTYLYYHGQIK